MSVSLGAPPAGEATRERAIHVVRGRRRRVDAGSVLRFLVLAGFVLFFVVPIVWLLFATTKTPTQLLRAAPLSFGSLHDLAHNWTAVHGFQDGAILTWLKNSAVYSLGALLLTLLVSVPAGYALALIDFKGRRGLLVITLVVMLMPSTALVLPVFLEVNAVNLVGTALSVILPFAFFPFGVYLTYIYFSTNLPRDLLSAARLDGCSEMQVFRLIALPLAKPVVALVGFFSFVGNWNNFFLPYVMLPSDTQYPLQVGLASMLASTPSFNPVVSPESAVQPPELALATLLSVAPILIVFLFSQRFLVAGTTAGGTKE